MISIRIHLVASKGKQEELRQAVENLSQKIILEDGCLECRVFQNTSNKSELVVIGDWKNLETAKAHVSSDNMSILAGAGTILADNIRVYPERDPDIQGLKTVFKARFSPKFETV